jgi:hypothetical protein
MFCQYDLSIQDHWVDQHDPLSNPVNSPTLYRIGQEVNQKGRTRILVSLVRLFIRFFHKDNIFKLRLILDIYNFSY